MNLQTILADRHTTGSGLAFLAIKGGSHIAVLWWPNHKEAIAGTADVLEGLAVAYMGAFAAGAKQMAGQLDQARADVKEAIDSHDTSNLTRAETVVGKPPNIP